MEEEGMFNVIGSYFVDILFNHVYVTAEENTDDPRQIGKVYNDMLLRYLKSVKRDKTCLRDTAGRLHYYFKSTTIYTTISYEEFVGMVIMPFLPKEDFSRLKYIQRDIVFNRIILQLLSQMVSAVLRPEMQSRIIKFRAEQHATTIPILQQYAVTVLKSVARESVNKFLRREVSKTSVPFSSLEEIKSALQQALIEKAELSAKCSRLEKEFAAMSEQLELDRNYYQYREAQFTNLVAQLGLQVKEFQAKTFEPARAKTTKDSLGDRPALGGGADHPDAIGSKSLAEEFEHSSDDGDGMMSDGDDEETNDIPMLSAEITKEFENFDKSVNSVAVPRQPVRNTGYNLRSSERSSRPYEKPNTDTRPNKTAKLNKTTANREDYEPVAKTAEAETGEDGSEDEVDEDAVDDDNADEGDEVDDGVEGDGGDEVGDEVGEGDDENGGSDEGDYEDSDNDDFSTKFVD